MPNYYWIGLCKGVPPFLFFSLAIFFPFWKKRRKSTFVRQSDQDVHMSLFSWKLYRPWCAKKISRRRANQTQTNDLKKLAEQVAQIKIFECPDRITLAHCRSVFSRHHSFNCCPRHFFVQLRTNHWSLSFYRVVNLAQLIQIPKVKRHLTGCEIQSIARMLLITYTWEASYKSYQTKISYGSLATLNYIWSCVQNHLICLVDFWRYNRYKGKYDCTNRVKPSTRFWP